MKDKYKGWELYKESKGAPPPDEDKHRNLNIEFFLTTKYDVLSSMIDPSAIKPYITNYEGARKVVFEVNRDLYINVEYESSMNIFLWQDLKNANKDDFLVQEMIKFQDSCEEALQDLVIELSEIKRIPLNFRYEPPRPEDEKLEQENLEQKREYAFADFINRREEEQFNLFHF
jgi:hypothetical protein